MGRGGEWAGRRPTRSVEGWAAVPTGVRDFVPEEVEVKEIIELPHDVKGEAGPADMGEDGRRIPTGNRGVSSGRWVE